MCPGEEVVEFKVKKSSASRRLMKLKDRKPRSDKPAVLGIGLVYMRVALVTAHLGPSGIYCTGSSSVAEPRPQGTETFY